METTIPTVMRKFIISETCKHKGERVIRKCNSILNVITDARRSDVYPLRL